MRPMLAVLVAAWFAGSVSAAGAQTTPPPVGPPAAPRWSLHYTAAARAMSVIRTYFVTVRSDGSVDWQQIDTETGIVSHGQPHQCGGAAQLTGDDLRTMQAAAVALGEARRSAPPPPYVTNAVSVALVTPRDAVNVDAAAFVFAPGAPDSDPRLNRAALIWSRYRCS